MVWYKGFLYQAASWKTARRVVAKVEFHAGELFPRVGFIVTNLTLPSRAVVRFYNKRGTAEQWIKEGKQAVKMTRLSCHRFRSNEVRLWLSVIAYNLGNLCVLLQRRYSRPTYKTSGLRSDHTVILAEIASAKAYPDPLRRVTYVDAETKKQLKFLTNNFALPALTIAQVYKCRWQVELFFKWIKQHLRIKAFYGTSENAVKTQIWIAVSIYVLVAIVRKRLGLEVSLYQILQILSVTLFEKVPILQALEASACQDDLVVDRNQLILFDL